MHPARIMLFMFGLDILMYLLQQQQYLIIQRLQLQSTVHPRLYLCIQFSMITVNVVISEPLRFYRIVISLPTPSD